MTRRERIKHAQAALRSVQAIEDQMLARGKQRGRPVSVFQLHRAIYYARILYALAVDRDAGKGTP